MASSLVKYFILAERMGEKKFLTRLASTADEAIQQLTAMGLKNIQVVDETTFHQALANSVGK